MLYTLLATTNAIIISHFFISGSFSRMLYIIFSATTRSNSFIFLFHLTKLLQFILFTYEIIQISDAFYHLWQWLINEYSLRTCNKSTVDCWLVARRQLPEHATFCCTKCCTNMQQVDVDKLRGQALSIRNQTMPAWKCSSLVTIIKLLRNE